MYADNFNWGKLMLWLGFSKTGVLFIQIWLWSFSFPCPFLYLVIDFMDWQGPIVAFIFSTKNMRVVYKFKFPKLHLFQINTESSPLFFWIPKSSPPYRDGFQQISNKHPHATAEKNAELYRLNMIVFYKF